MNSIILSGMAWAASLKDAVTSWVREEAGQDIMEYAVVVGAIAIVAGFVLLAGGGQWLNDALTSMEGKITACIEFSSTCGS